MALPPLPPDNTVRYFLDYIVAGEAHSMQCRATDTVDDATAVAELHTQATFLALAMGSNCSFTGVSKCVKFSNVRNPVGGFATITGALAVIADPARPFETGFAGRSSTGRKVKAFLFGVQGIAIPTSWADTPITQVNLSAFRNSIAVSTELWRAIDGSKPTWYDKVTYGYNDHWIAAVRP